MSWGGWKLEGTLGCFCPEMPTDPFPPVLFTAVISSSNPGAVGAGASFGFSSTGNYGYRTSSVGGGYSILSGGCVTGGGNCSPRGETKARLGSASEFKDVSGKNLALGSPTKKTMR